MNVQYDKLIRIYLDELCRKGYKAVQCDLDKYPVYDNFYTRRYEHLVYMLEQLKDETDENKINRWLGFIQGVLWTDGFYSINDLREHINSCKIHESPI